MLSLNYIKHAPVIFLFLINFTDEILLLIDICTIYYYYVKWWWTKNVDCKLSQTLWVYLCVFHVSLDVFITQKS